MIRRRRPRGATSGICYQSPRLEKGWRGRLFKRATHIVSKSFTGTIKKSLNSNSEATGGHMANLREALRGALVSRVAMVSVFFILAHAAVAHGQPAPAISVTVNKSMVFRLAERAKRVSVSQPAVADVIVVAPSQLLINGKAVGATSLIVFNEQGEASNFLLIVAPDVAALRGQLRVVLPNEKIEVSTSGTFLVLRGEVSNEVVYDKVLEITGSYLPPKPPAAVAPAGSTTNVSVGRGSQRQSVPTSGVGFAGGGRVAF